LTYLIASDDKKRSKALMKEGKGNILGLKPAVEEEAEVEVTSSVAVGEVVQPSFAVQVFVASLSDFVPVGEEFAAFGVG
jgi:hypothetical protein